MAIAIMMMMMMMTLKIMLLRHPISTAQGKTAKMPASEATSSKPYSTPFRTFTPLCSCESIYPAGVWDFRGLVLFLISSHAISRLVFMTYNGWVMVAVSLGAFFGYLLFGHSTSATKDNACH